MSAADPSDKLELSYFRIPVRITRADVERLDKAAKLNGVTLGWYLDVIIADKANELRTLAGEPVIQSPFFDDRDRWRAIQRSD